MNTKRKGFVARLAALWILALVAVAGMAFPAWAANGRIQFSDPSATVGSEVTVNLKVSTTGGESLSRADIALSYDSNALEFVSGNSVEGGSGALRAHGSPDSSEPSTIVFSMVFQAKQAGSSQITVTSQEVYDGDGQVVTMDHVGNSTVTVQAVANASSDASLASLQVSPGTLSPAFSSDTDAYSVNVGTDVERLTVNVELSDPNAMYTVTGNEDLQMGENTVVCRVTAQDGQTVKDYTITVVKDENGASAGSEGTGTTAESVSLEAAAKAITIISLDEGVTIPEGFQETTIDIDGHKVTGWIWASDDTPDYCVFYGMNSAGEKNFYRYDLTEKTIQRYFQDPAIDTGVTMEEHTAVVNQYNDLLHDFQIQRIVMIVLIAVVLVLFVLVIYLLVKKGKTPPSGGSRRRGSRPRQREYDVFEEDEEEEPYEEAEDRYMRGEEDEYEDVGEIQLEPQVRRPRTTQEDVREYRRPEPVREVRTQPSAGRRSNSNLDQTQVLPHRSERPRDVQQEETARESRTQRPVSRRQAPHGAGAAGHPAGRPVPVRPADAPQRPVQKPVPQPKQDELDDDDFEFLDIDE